MKLTTKQILRMERLKRGWTQEDVANMLNMGRASYAQYETGKNIPTTENIIKLAQIYRVPTDYLLQVDYGEAIKFSMKQGKEWGEELADEYIEKGKKACPKKEGRTRIKTSASAPYGLPPTPVLRTEAG